MSHFLEQYPEITDLKSHLVNRVIELRGVLNKTSVDRFIIKGTILVNVEVYEIYYGEFPNRKALFTELNITPKLKPKKVYIGDFSTCSEAALHQRSIWPQALLHNRSHLVSACCRYKSPD